MLRLCSSTVRGGGLVSAFLVALIAFTSDTIAAPDNHGFEITVAGGLTYVAMGDINDVYIEKFAEPFGLIDDDVNSGLILFGEAGLALLPYVSVYPGLSYTRGTADGSLSMKLYEPTSGPEPIGSATMTHRVTTSMIAPHLRVKCRVLQGPTSLFVTVGGLFGFATAAVETDWEVNGPSLPDLDESDEYTAQGLGFMVSIGGQRNVSNTLDLGVELGYRYLKTGDLEDDNGKPWTVGGPDSVILPESTTMELDFSGLFVIGTLSFNL